MSIEPSRRMIPVCLLGLLVCASGGSAIARGPSDIPSALDLATQANASHDIERERRVLERAERLDGDPDGAADVQRRLAVIEWRYHRYYDRAGKRLRRAATAAEPVLAWLALARMEQHRGEFSAAAAAASRAMETAEKERDRRIASLAWARAVVGRATKARQAGQRGVTDDLRRARDVLHEKLQEASGLLEEAQLLLRAALVLDDGETARFAWRSFFQLNPGSPLPSGVAAPGAELMTLLPAWAGPEATTRQRIDLVRALAGTRFFLEAGLLARDPAAAPAVREDRNVHEILSYIDFTQNLKQKIDEHYRLCILGDCDGSRQKREREAEIDRFVKALAQGDDPPGRNTAVAYIESRFGGHLSVGYTAGYPDTHYGHAVIDERRTVEQYGRRAEVRFLSLDQMVSNGFQSWAWEGGGQHGGWEGGATIYEIRPAFVKEIAQIARGIKDTDERREFEARMHEESERDEERARADPYAYLPGLRMRLTYQALSRLLERVETQLETGDDPRLQFIEELSQVTRETLIFAHEGRHAIDELGADPHAPTWRLEYNAKLSQVAFAPEPRLGMANIIGATVGDQTPHGKASLQVVKQVVKWMDRHREEIDELDADRPLLPQLDRLTDGQLKTLFRQLDPLSAEGGRGG